jgi:DNA-binding IclR family transcriptional regulator
MPQMPTPQHAEAGRAWTFLTNHAHVLICLDLEGDLPLRVVAARVGITERAVQRIVADLEEAGILRRQRSGRRNVYQIHARKPLRHPLEAHRRVEDLLRLMHKPGA